MLYNIIIPSNTTMTKPCYSDLKKQLPTLAEQGLTYDEMGEKLGVSKYWVHKWMGRLGIKSHYSLNNSQTHCTECNILLDKSKLKGNLCMKCLGIYQNRYKNEKKKIAVEHLGNKCMDCGKTYPSAVYDFHHLRDKEECVSIMIRNNLKIETILEEVDKCVLLCANCHRIRHAI